MTHSPDISPSSEHWCEECDCEMNMFTDENGRDAWGCDECGWSEIRSPRTNEPPIKELIQQTPITPASSVMEGLDSEALIDRIEAWNGDSPDMLKSSAIELVREYAGYAARIPASSVMEVLDAKKLEVALSAQLRMQVGLMNDNRIPTSNGSIFIDVPALAQSVVAAIKRQVDGM